MGSGSIHIPRSQKDSACHLYKHDHEEQSGASCVMTWNKYLAVGISLALVAVLMESVGNKAKLDPRSIGKRLFNIVGTRRHDARPTRTKRSLLRVTSVGMRVGSRRRGLRRQWSRASARWRCLMVL